MRKSIIPDYDFNELFYSVESFPYVAIFGDWHMSSPWALSTIDRVCSNNKIKVLLHVGDFGLWTGRYAKSYLVSVDRMLEKHNAIILVTPGNLEDYDRLENAKQIENAPEGFRAIKDYKRIIFIDRGSHWTWNNHKFMSFGGANSIDFERRTVGKDWWLQEQITDEHVSRVHNVGKVDVMISHDAPMGIPISSRSEALKFGFSMSGLEYAEQSSVMMRKVTDIVKPDLIFYGHYHKRKHIITNLTDENGVDYKVDSLCLNKEYSEGNSVFLNTETLKFN